MVRVSVGRSPSSAAASAPVPQAIIVPPCVFSRSRRGRPNLDRPRGRDDLSQGEVVGRIDLFRGRRQKDDSKARAPSSKARAVAIRADSQTTPVETRWLTRRADTAAHRPPTGLPRPRARRGRAQSRPPRDHAEHGGRRSVKVDHLAQTHAEGLEPLPAARRTCAGRSAGGRRSWIRQRAAQKSAATASVGPTIGSELSARP